MIIVVNTFYSKAQWPPSDPAYNIVFGDEFNDTTGYNGKNIDNSKWIPFRPWNNDSTKKMVIYDRPNPTPDDTVIYDLAGYNFNDTDTSNVHVINGVCRLIARRGPFSSNYWTYPYPCTSSACAGYYCFNSSKPDSSACFKPVPATFKYSNGSLASKSKFRFGYFEIKFRLPSNISTPNINNNYLPTCWLFANGSHQNPPIHSEIDIYEIDGKDNRFTNTVWYKYDNNFNKFGDHAPNVATVSKGVWHTAAIDWTTKYVDFYYDGNFVRRVSSYADSLDAMGVLIEAYIPNEWSEVNVDSVNTPFPYVYEIDYFRVYQINEACSTSQTYNNATVATFQSKLYKDLTLNTNCYFNNGTLSALGNDFVLIDQGTTVDNNMTMYFDVKPCNMNVIAPALTQMPTPNSEIFQQRRIR